MATLIEAVELTSQNVAPGEPVEFAVALAAAAAGAVVSIDGVRGEKQVLQAPTRPGPWRVQILAGHPVLGIDRQEQIVTVRDEPRVIPVLGIRHDPFQAYSVAFSFPLDAFPDGTIFAWAVGPLVATTTIPIFSANLKLALDDTRLLTIVPVDVEVRFPDGTRLQARRTLTLWSLYQTIRSTGLVSPPVFSDGSATRRPINGPSGMEMGNFAASFTVQNLEPQELRFTSLQVQWMPPDGHPGVPPGPPQNIDIRVPAGGVAASEVEIDATGAPTGTVSCVIHLSGAAGEMPAHSELGLDLRTLAPRAILELPPIEKAWPPDFEDWGIDIIRDVRPELEQDGRLSFSGAWLIGEMAGAIRRNAEAITAAPRELSARPARPERAGAPGVRGFAEQRAQGLDLLRAQAGATSFRRGAVIESGIDISAAEAGAGETPTVALRGAFVPAGRFDEIRNDIIVRQPDFDLALLPDDVVGGRFDVGQVIAPPPPAAGIVPGSPCDPDNLPANLPPNMACQFAGRYEDFIQPHRVMNAEKGDIFLSPGGSGVIGQLLRQVQPPQRYAHSGIFTRRQTEVAHSTASEDWLKKEHTGGVWSPPFSSEDAPSDGFKPASLKYIWPGGVIQNVDQAIGKSPFKAPDGKTYMLEGFSPNGGFAEFSGNWESIPAVLVKPHPLEDTLEVRGKLSAVADKLRELCVTGADTEAGRQSKLHYRFFCYTDATFVTPAPGDAGWAVGTIPSVCSQAVWLAAKAAGVDHFEGDLDPDDHAVQRATDTPDGLYVYTKEERADAATWLHSYYVDEVERELEEKTNSGVIAAVWDFFSDMADDVANQIVNTFAHDWSDTEAKDSEKWKDEPSAGQAVSPDDIMRWDGPSRGGLWGTVVPMDYRPPYPDQRPVYVWRQTSGPGTLKLLVTHRGAPMGGADVDVGGKSAPTDAAGKVSLVLDEGPYVAVAGAHINGVGYAEARAEVTVLFNQTVDFEIRLQDPPDSKRLVVVEIRGTISDAEDFASDETKAVGGSHDFRVHPWGTHDEWGWKAQVGGEVRGELYFKVDLNMDKSVRIHVDGSFFEGTSEDTDDLEMTQAWDWTVAKDGSITRSLDLWNKDEDEPGDALRVVAVVHNRLQP